MLSTSYLRIYMILLIRPNHSFYIFNNNSIPLLLVTPKMHIDLPFNASINDVEDWMKEIGVVDTNLLFCQRELVLDRLRPSGVGFFEFSNHQSNPLK